MVYGTSDNGRSLGTKFYLVGEVGKKAFPVRDTLAARAVTGVSGVNGLIAYHSVKKAPVTSVSSILLSVILYLWIGIPTFRSYVGLNLLFKPGGNDFQVNQARWPAWPEIPRENTAKKTSRNIVT